MDLQSSYIQLNRLLLTHQITSRPRKIYNLKLLSVWVLLVSIYYDPTKFDQVKIVTFIDDLVVERHDAELTTFETSNKNSPDAVEANERLRQYRLLDLQHTLKDNHW